METERKLISMLPLNAYSSVEFIYPVCWRVEPVKLVFLTWLMSG